MNADWPDLAGRLTAHGHTMPIRIYYEDTDFSGVVYHASYLRFLERGRSDFLRLVGIGHRELDGEGLGFVVRRMVLDFLGPARIDDVLEVETRAERLGGASLELSQTARLDGRDLFRAAVTVALVDRAGRPRRWPQDVRAALANVIAPSSLS